ncbi:hypothetical protein PCE1_002525 [Barthelona sp. PCE]
MHILSIDQGTTSTRVIAFNCETGVPDYIAQKEHGVKSEKPGWASVCASEIWSNTVHCLKEVSEHVDNVVCCGLTNQRETLVIWDKNTGKPIYDSILWSDARTNGIVDRIVNKNGSRCVADQTGLIVSTYFTAMKIVWAYENVQEVKEAIDGGECLLGTVDCWLCWKLTGNHYTDVTNASRTMLLDIKTMEWDLGLFTKLDVPHAVLQCLPSVKASSANFGTIQLDVFNGVKLTSLIGDQQAALVGQYCFEPGDFKCTYGTGAFCLLNIGSEARTSKHGMLTTIAYQEEGSAPVYAFEGSVAVCGSAIGWMRDNLCLFDSVKDIEPLINSVESNSGVVFIPALNGLLAPYWCPTARAEFVGLSQYTKKAHLIRAVIESIAFQVYDVVKIMEEESGKVVRIMKVDGGVTNSTFMCQFQADLLKIQLQKASMKERTALGAAIMAGKFVDCEIQEVTGMMTVEPSEMDVGPKIKTWKSAINRAIGN